MPCRHPARDPTVEPAEATARHQHRAARIDEVPLASHQDNRRVGVHRLDLHPQAVRIDEVVPTDQFQHLTSSRCGNTLPVARRATACFCMQQSHPRISAVALESLPRPVRAGVVGHDQLEVLEGLRQDRVHRRLDEASIVVGGHHDGHAGSWVARHLWRSSGEAARLNE